MSKPVHIVKVRKIGNSLGITLPKEALARLKLQEGDQVSLSTEGDAILVVPSDPHFEESMKALDESIQQYRNTYRELAK